MKSISIRFILTFFVVLFIQSSYSNPRLRIAILDLKAGVGRSQSQVDGLADMLGVELYNSGYFTVIERGQLNTVLNANNISTNAKTSPEQLKLIGKKLNVSAVLIGTVNFIARDSKLASDGITRFESGEYNIDIRLVSVENGEWLSSAGLKECGTERSLMTKLAQQLAKNLDNSILPNNNNSPKILLDYLYVAPADLGYFSSSPENIINITNKQVLCGYRDWRLPTREELDLLRANARLLNLEQGASYAYDGMRWNGEYAVRLVRSKVVVQQKTSERQYPYFEETTHDFGAIPILSGSVKKRFRLLNPSPFDTKIENVTTTSSSISVDWTRTSIETGGAGYVYITYNPNGRQGVHFNNAINVHLSSGKTLTIYVTGYVE